MNTASKQVLGLGAMDIARGTATKPQQEKSNSLELQRKSEHSKCYRLYLNSGTSFVI
jgi:hypothetical protein